MENLRSTSEETKQSQTELASAFSEGTTNYKQLVTIFGASLNPALDEVSKKLGITTTQLVGLIDSGKIGSDVVLPALAAAARSSTSVLEVMTQATKFSHEEIQKLVETSRIAGNEVIPGMATALGQSSEQISLTDKSINNLSTSWNFFLKQVGDLLTQKSALGDFWGSVKTNWNIFYEQQFKNWDQLKANTVNSISEIGLGLGVLTNDVKEGFTVIGETIGNTLGAIATWNFQDLGDSLDQMLQRSATRITDFTNKANDMVKRLWDGKSAAEDSKKTMDDLGEAIKSVPLVKFSDDLEEVFKKINNTTEASNAVSLIWKELSKSDPFSGKDQSTLLLATAIKKVQDNTGDAQGTLDAFGKKLSELPSEQLLKLLNTSQSLSEKLKQVGDSGQLAQVITSAAFQKLGLDASNLSDGYSKLSTDTTQAFAVIANSANSTGEQIKAAFNKALDTANTQKDIELLKSVFDKLAQSGKLTANEITLGFAKIAERQAELATRTNAVSESFKLLGVTSSKELDKISNTAKAAFSVIENGSTSVKNIETSFLAWADAEITAANAANKPIDPLLQQKAAALGLSNALDELIRNHQQLTPEVDALISKSERVDAALQQNIRSVDLENEAKRRSIQASIELARSKGDEFTAYQKTIELSKLELSSVQSRIALNQQLINSLDIQVNSIYAAANADGEYSEAEQKVVSNLIETIKALREKNALASQQIPIIQQNIQNQELQSVSNGKQADSQKNVNQQLKEGEKNAAGYVKQGELMVKHTNDAGPALQGLANYLQQTRDLMDSLSTKTRLLFEVEMTRYINMRGLDGAYKAHQSALAAYNETLTESERREAKFNLELKNAQDLIEQTKEKSITAATGFQIWETAIEKAAGIAKRAFYEQAIAAENLQQQVESFTDSGIRNISSATSRLEQFANAANNNFSMLDEKDLANLRGAIADANKKLEVMIKNTKQAEQDLESLNEQILREKGNSDDADKLALSNEERQKMIELESKLSEAKANNQTQLVNLYQEEINKLKELYDLKEKNLNQSIKDRQESERAAKANNTTTSTSSSNSGVSSGSTTTHVLKLQAPDGQTATTNVDSEAAVNQILSILQKAGLRMAG